MLGTCINGDAVKNRMLGGAMGATSKCVLSWLSGIVRLVVLDGNAP
jgi:hypothetical protein